ncbi:hypothetical protein HanPSC8_Chr08g0314861 [Helianthus annuus]|nr:hypothetical protein HanPSC8_Chr08g0314861 [Helianthus annuus]
MGNKVVLMLISFLLIISFSNSDASPFFRGAFGTQSKLPPKNTGSHAPVTPDGPSTGKTSTTNNTWSKNFQAKMNRFREKMKRMRANMRGVPAEQPPPYPAPSKPEDENVPDYETGSYATEQPPPPPGIYR